MCKDERFDFILQYLKQNKRMSIDEICSFCSVSKEIASADLEQLLSGDKIIRTYSGAMYKHNDHEKKTANYAKRLTIDSMEKRKIAQKAYELVNEGEMVILDTSTTVETFSYSLKYKKCTVITNSIEVADVLMYSDDVNVLMLGGKINKIHRFCYGSLTINTLSNYYADKCFLGALGVSREGISVDNEDDAEVMRKMTEQSREVVVLADKSKFNRLCHYKVCDLKNVSIIITDELPDEDFINSLKENGVELIVS